MTALLTVLVGLGVPGLLPAIAVARRSPAVIFLAPVIGAIFAAVAAELELGVGSSLFDWYLPIALVVNAALITWWLVIRASGTRLVLSPAESAVPPARRSGEAAPRSRFPEWAWYAITVATLLGALAVPLIALRGDRIGWDSNSIWMTHALMIFGGHQELLTSMQNRTYAFSNPNYPPLVPASGALAFKFFGMGSLLVAVDTTVFLTACALGVAGAGIVSAASGASPLPRAVAVMTGGALCIAGFAVSNKYGVDGHADLLWAAAAAAAIIWGLVLPRSTQALAMAWTCAVAASLTKNEGLTTALIVLVLIALRYRPLRIPRLIGRAGSRPAGWPALTRWARAWAERAAFVLAPAVPSLAWAGLIHLLGIHDAFFSASSGQSLLTRAHFTINAMSVRLRIVPVAFVMLVAGSLVLRRYRRSARLANPAWLWTAWLGSLAIIFATYVFGAYPIRWWLITSVDRTTIFAQVLLYADICIWLVIALVGASGRDVDTVRTAANPAVQPGAAGDARAPAAPSPAARP